MQRLKIVILFLFLFVPACSTASTSTTTSNPSTTTTSTTTTSTSIETAIVTPKPVNIGAEVGPVDLGSLDMSLVTLGEFHASFTLVFRGNSKWVYRVDTRSGGEQIEYSLHIEGVDGAQNPGDVRLVNSNGINQMNGPGTDNACVQFSDDFETKVLFLSPDDLIDLENFSEELEPEGEDTVAGRAAFTYLGDKFRFEGWGDVHIAVWIDQETDAVLQIKFNAKGQDPMFGAGGGEFTGLFVVEEIGFQDIEPIEGCEIDVPLPNDAYDVLIFPGLIAFKTSLGPVKLDYFYQVELLSVGWRWEKPTISNDRNALLTFFSDTRDLNIHVNPLSDDFSEGYQVEVFIEDK